MSFLIVSSHLETNWALLKEDIQDIKHITKRATRITTEIPNKKADKPEVPTKYA